MSSFTPGPWAYIDATQVAKMQFAPKCVIKSGRKQITSFGWNNDGVYFPTKLESQANARLIAAAPDLIEECQCTQRVCRMLLDGLDWLSENGGAPGSWIKNQRELIEARIEESKRVTDKANGFSDAT